MKVFHINNSREFIFTNLKKFCNKKGTLIKYIAPYIYKKNRLAKQEWQIIVIIKDLLLIDSSLLLEFWAKVIDIANYF